MVRSGFSYFILDNNTPYALVDTTYYIAMFSYDDKSQVLPFEVCMYPAVLRFVCAGAGYVILCLYRGAGRVHYFCLS
jgi:hypothetical protein